MSSLQEQYDEASHAYSLGEYDQAIQLFEQILQVEADHFDALQGLSMAYYRQGNYPRAIEIGHQAEKLRPKEQLVHTNLSLFYMKSGDKKTAEHHGLQARIASWRENMTPPDPNQPAAESELQLAKPPTPPIPPPEKFPDMPWRKNKKPH